MLFKPRRNSILLAVLLIEHFIINYPEDGEKFLKEFGQKSQKSYAVNI